MGTPPVADAGPGQGWPFVGREDELAAIAEARTRGCAGMVLSADAGIGKSRLGREAVAAAERAGALTEWIQATRSASLVPLGACAALLPQEVPSHQSFRLLQSTIRQLHERAGGSPIVVGVDDAQWLDPVSATLVLQLATGGDAFILATIRAGESCPDAVVSLWKDAGAPRLELRGLPDPEIRGLIEAALEGPVEEEMARWILDRSAGNPMYAHELLRGAVSEGSLTWSDGLWRLSGPVSIARTLVEHVEQRIAALPTELRAPLELLALAEPLQVDELAGLTSYDVLADVESEGLVEVSAGAGEVRLAHPMYADALRAALPALRARGLRVRLADALLRRDQLTTEDTVRVVRMLQDAHAPIPAALLVQGAEAANVAGDPDLAAELARRAVADGAGLAAALPLARALAARGAFREAEDALRAAEPEAAGHPRALEYLDERVRVLFWGSGHTDDARAILDRARGWSDDPTWPWRLLAVSMPAAVAEDLPGAIAAVRGALHDPGLDRESRRALEPRYAMALFYVGDWTLAQATARRCLPPIPVPDYPGLVALTAFRLAGIESGAEWEMLEAELTQILVEGVRGHDDEAAAHGALGLAQLAFLRGRLKDAERWLAEAELHFEREDVWGTIAEALVLRVRIACLIHDIPKATDALARLRAIDDHGRPRPLSRPAYRARAEAWVDCAREGATAAPRFLVAAEPFAANMSGLAAVLVYDGLLAGASPRQVSPVLEALAQRCDAPLVRAYAAHGRALAAGDGEALLRAAELFENIGANRYAMTATAQAASTFREAGRHDSARRADTRARALHTPGQGIDPPAAEGSDGLAGLTARERQIVELARRGATNAELAERLAVSVRTVETHLYRAMHKLGVRDRRDL
jgi:DNA-binding CsgD family transcriptional regulator